MSGPSLCLVVDRRDDGPGVPPARLPDGLATIADQTVVVVDPWPHVGPTPAGPPETPASRSEDGPRHRVLRVPAGADLRPVLAAALCTDWYLLLGGDEVPGSAAAELVPRLTAVPRVDAWRLPLRAVWGADQWLSGPPWSPRPETRLLRVHPRRRPPVVRSASLPVYQGRLALLGPVARWQQALGDDVLATAHRRPGRRPDPGTPDGGGFEFWLPERHRSPPLEPVTSADAAVLRRTVGPSVGPPRAPVPARSGTAAPPRGPDRDKLLARTAPALTAVERRDAVLLESLLRPVAAGGHIPRILHRVWLGGRRVPDAFAAFERTWRRHHPGWTHRLWTEANLPPLWSAPVLGRARYFAEQADVVRLELLVRFGGVYVDMDFECLRPLDPLLDGVGAFAGLERAGWVGNAVLGSAPGHPAYRFALSQVMRLIGRGKNPVEATGPFVLSRVLAEFPGVTLFPPEVFYPVPWDHRGPVPSSHPSSTHAVHHWALSHLEPAGADDVAAVARLLGG